MQASESLLKLVSEMKLSLALGDFEGMNQTVDSTMEDLYKRSVAPYERFPELQPVGHANIYLCIPDATMWTPTSRTSAQTFPQRSLNSRGTTISPNGVSRQWRPKPTRVRRELCRKYSKR